MRLYWSAGMAAVIALMLLLACRVDARVSELFPLYVNYKKWIDFPLLILLPLFLGQAQKAKRVPLREKKRKAGRAALGIGGVLLCAGFLSGCQKQSDTEEKSYILSLYVEDSEDGYQYWTAAADLSAMEGKEQSIPCKVSHFEAAGLKDLEKQYQKSQVGEPEWNHIFTIFIGRRLARSDQKLFRFLEEWEKEWQKSPNVLLSICSGDAEQLYKLENIAEGSAGQEISRLSEQEEQNGGRDSSLCRTPIEVLKAAYAGKSKVKLYHTIIEENGFKLEKQTLRLSNVPSENE